MLCCDPTNGNEQYQRIKQAAEGTARTENKGIKKENDKVSMYILKAKVSLSLKKNIQKSSVPAAAHKYHHVIYPEVCVSEFCQKKGWVTAL